MKNKNKTRYLQSILGAIMAVSAALILSCEQPDGPSLGSVSTGTGTVTLTVSKGEPSDGKVVKTILPTGLGDDAFVKYDFAFDFSTGEDNDFTDNGVTDLTGYQKTLLAGYWKVTVSAYLDPDGEVEDDEYVAAVGEATFTVTAGQTGDAVTVHVKPVALASTATGTFEYTVDLSGLSEITVSSGTLTLTPSAGDPTIVSYDTEKKTWDPEGPVELPAGVYHLSIVLSNKDGLKAWHTDKVHIYAGFVSKQEDAFAFEDDDFQQVVYLAGTLTLPEGVTSENTVIKAYRDAGYGNVVDVTDTSYNDENDEWLGFISVESIGTLYIKLVVTGSDSITYTYTTGADGVTVTKDGDDNITLTLDKADVGADATLDVDSLESLFDDVDDITVSKDFEVEDEDALEIAAGKTLTVTGELTVAGEITVAGDLDLTAATVEVTGTVSVSDGGTLKVLTTATDAFYGEETSGKLVLAQGSTVTVGTPSSVLLATDNSGRFKFTSVSDGELELGPGSMTLKSGVLDLINEGYWIQAGDTATIEDGATFNITADNTFHVSGTFTVGGSVTIESGGKLTGTNGDDSIATIVVKDGKTITGSANTNFYAAGGTKLSSHITPSGSDLTFTWDATLDSNNGGWRETAAFGNITADDLKDIISTAANDGGDVYLSNVTIEEPEEGTAKLDFGQAAVTVAGSLTVPANVTVTVGTNDDGGSLTVEPGATLEIAASATLEVKKGTLEVAGELEVAESGTLKVDADATLSVAGDLAVAGELEVSGTVSIADGGTLKAPALGDNGLPVDGKEVSFDGDGTVELAKGATGYYGDLLFISSDDSGLYKWSDDADVKVTLKANNVTEVSGGEITVIANTGIASGASIVVNSTAKLSVADEVTYAVGGELEVAGDLEVTGELTVISTGAIEVSGDFTVEGTLNVQENAEVNVAENGVFFLDGTNLEDEETNGTLTGTITIASGAKTYSTGTFAGNGWTVIEAGGEAYAHQSPDAENPKPPTVGGSNAVFNLTKGTFALNASGYLLDGEVTQLLGEQYNGGGANLQVRLQVTLEMKAGSVLTIPGPADPIGDRVLIIYPDTYPVTGAPAGDGKAASKIVVTGYLEFYKIDSNDWITELTKFTNLNFYDTNNSKVTTNDQQGTFVWDSTLNEGNGGWKKQSDE